jgi:putative hydrolase of the HAD superfamily
MIQAILFDADGVLQRPAAYRSAAWQHLVTDQNVEEFIAALGDAEAKAIAGGRDFVTACSDLIVRWQCKGGIQEALRVWTMIEPDADIVDVVRALRQNGLTCCLATNQEPYRASFMSQQLGYSRLFDREFYSCHMGIAKPEPAYFRSIVDELGVSAANVLFLDDREDNVNGAKEAGLNAAQFGVDSGSQHLAHTLRQFGIDLASGSI